MMKKINYFYMGLALVFISLLMSAVNSYAWSNGYRNIVHPGHETTDYISIYYDDYTRHLDINSPRTYFGTHDWVAENALEILYLHKSSDPFLAKLWDINNPDRLRIWFLVGTELPDRLSDFKNVDLRTRCGNPVSVSYLRSGKLTHNKLVFGNLYGFPIDDSAAQLANVVYGNILMAFELKDCQLAAILMGALMHIIADASFYQHLLEGVPADHHTMYWHVDHLTFRTWAAVNGDRQNEFLNINEALSRITAASQNSPYLATLLCGRDTWLGDIYGTPTIKDARWMFDRHPTGTNHRHWYDVQGLITYEDQHTWTYSMRPNNPQNPDPRDYFNTLEHNLNMAIYYCATALNYILINGGYESCECTGEAPPSPDQDPNPKDKDKEAVAEGVKSTLNEFQALMFFSFSGFAASMLALTMQKSLEKLLKGVITLPT